MITYNKFDMASLGETIGWTSAAGYLEGRVTSIDTRKKTACKQTLSDWVLVEILPYFARFEGETAYLNANFLMGNGKVRRLQAAPESAYGKYVAKRRSFGDAVMSEREFERLALTMKEKTSTVLET